MVYTKNEVALLKKVSDCCRNLSVKEIEAMMEALRADEVEVYSALAEKAGLTVDELEDWYYIAQGDLNYG